MFGIEYVRTHFADDVPLATQQLTHNRYRTNAEPLIDHILRCLALTGREAVLDLGCGNGFILRDVVSRLREGGRVVALDVAPAMIELARRNVTMRWVPVEWVNGRAEDLSRFSDGEFDRVMANFLFHYIDDPGVVCREMARVLSRDGRALVTVEARGSMPEMYDLHFETMTKLGFPLDFIKRLPRGRRGRLSLENAGEILAGYFDAVEEHAYPDSLRFRSAKPFMEFYAVGHRYCGAQAMANGRVQPEAFGELYAAVEAAVQRRISAAGYFEVSKFNSSFICRAK